MPPLQGAARWLEAAAATIMQEALAQQDLPGAQRGRLLGLRHKTSDRQAHVHTWDPPHNGSEWSRGGGEA